MCVRANSCNTESALTRAGYIRTAVNLSCYGNLGTTSGQWSDQTERGRCCRSGESNRTSPQTIEQNERGVSRLHHVDVVSAIVSFFFIVIGGTITKVFCVVISAKLCILISFASNSQDWRVAEHTMNKTGDRSLTQCAENTKLSVHYLEISLFYQETCWCLVISPVTMSWLN